MASVTDVVGYVFDGDLYCCDCTVFSFGATNVVFRGSEWDYPTYCAHCQEPIDTVDLSALYPDEYDKR